VRVYYDLFVHNPMTSGQWIRTFKEFETEQQAKMFIHRIKHNVIVKSITLDTWHTEN